MNKVIFYKPKKEYFESEKYVENTTKEVLGRSYNNFLLVKDVRIALQVARLEGMILATNDQKKNNVYKTQIKNLLNYEK